MSRFYYLSEFPTSNINLSLLVSTSCIFKSLALPKVHLYQKQKPTNCTTPTLADESIKISCTFSTPTKEFSRIIPKGTATNKTITESILARPPTYARAISIISN